MKRWSPCVLRNMNKIWKLWKTNPDHVKFCNKNVNVVEKNYIKAQKYLTMKRKVAFYWLIVFCYHDDTYILACERSKWHVHCARWRYDFLGFFSVKDYFWGNPRTKITRVRGTLVKEDNTRILSPNLYQEREHRCHQFHVNHVVSNEFTEASKSSSLFTQFYCTDISLLLCR